MKALLPDRAHCPDCGRAVAPGLIHTCSPQVKSPEPDLNWQCQHGDASLEMED